MLKTGTAWILATIMALAAPVTQKPAAIIGLNSVAAELEQYNVYLLGESHGNTKTYEVEIELIKYFHNRFGVRAVLLEIGACDAALLNGYLESGDKTILDSIMTGLKGAASYNHENRKFYENLGAFYRSLPREERFTLYGVDVQHQALTGVRYLQSFLGEDAPKEVREDFNTLFGKGGYEETRERFEEFYVRTQENPVYKDYLKEDYALFCRGVDSVLQGLTYYAENSEEYREQCFTDNALAAYDKANGKCLGIWGDWHTKLSGWPNDWTHNTTAQNMAECLGTGQGGVASISFVYKNSQSHTSDGVISQDCPAGLALSGRVGGETAFFKLLEDDPSPAVRALSADHQYAVSITDSPAATPYDKDKPKTTESGK